MYIKTFKSDFAFIFFVILLAGLFISGCEKDPFDADSGTFTDKRDDHEYKWVKIGEQIWMAENLAYAPTVCGPTANCGIYVYGYLGTGSYGENYTLYGCLYDWETAQKVCPDGWHLPSDEEWMELEQYLGMPFKELDKMYFVRGENENIGGKLKENGYTHWNSPNTGATNEVDFCARAGGLFHERFVGLKSVNAFWTSSKIPGEEIAIGRGLFNNSNGIMRSPDGVSNCYSVRCIKN